ncbi:hypothetical protein GCM10029964_013480 [Kibdelosporangium lantanae]
MFTNDGCGGLATGRMFGNDGCWPGNGGGSGGRAWLASASLRRCLAGGGAGLIAAAGVSGTGMFGTARFDNDRFGADRFGIEAVSGNDDSRTGGTGVVISTRAGRDMGIDGWACGRAIGIDGCSGLACRAPPSPEGADGTAGPRGGTGPRPRGGPAGAGGRATGGIPDEDMVGRGIDPDDIGRATGDIPADVEVGLATGAMPADVEVGRATGAIPVADALGRATGGIPADDIVGRGTGIIRADEPDGPVGAGNEADAIAGSIAAPGRGPARACGRIGVWTIVISALAIAGTWA